jgi:hypothetical protein
MIFLLLEVDVLLFQLKRTIVSSHSFDPSDQLFELSGRTCPTSALREVGPPIIGSIVPFRSLQLEVTAVPPWSFPQFQPVALHLRSSSDPNTSNNTQTERRRDADSCNMVNPPSPLSSAPFLLFAY